MTKQIVQPTPYAPSNMEKSYLPAIEAEPRASISRDSSNQDQPRPLNLEVEKTLLWPNGQHLLVKFLGGSEDLHNKVKTAAKVWEEHANITFEFVDTRHSDIHISFDERGGSFSFVGTVAHRIPDNMATMNLMTVNLKSQMVERQILHELGHTLGCIHEHCSPTAGLLWNKEHVYSHYKGLGWGKETLDDYFFREYTPDAVDFFSI